MKETQFQVATPHDFIPMLETVLAASNASDAAQVVTLTGDLGAGKTTFTQQLAQYLGITESVVSPTFGIMKGYELDGHDQFDQLVHIDAYRIEDESEVGPLRLQEVFAQTRTLVCVEWPEQIPSVIPDTAIKVSISIGVGEERVVTVVAPD